MRWLKASFYAMVDSGERDRLGNRKRTRTRTCEASVRPTPYGTGPTDVEGNPYHDGTLTLVTMVSLAKISGACDVEVTSPTGEVERYAVARVSDLGRRRVVTCSREKGAE